MKPKFTLQSMLAVAAIAVTSCSAPKMAQQTSNQDDVYTSAPTAIVYTPKEETVTDNQAGDDRYATSDPYYDMDYSTRINRFYYSSPWRGYYDNFYGSSYYPWYSPSYSFNIYWNNPFGFRNRYYDPYGYYGYNYNPYNRYYGYNNPYSFGGSYYQGYSVYRPAYVDPNYGARPVRGRENGTSYTPGYGTANQPSGGVTNQGRARTETPATIGTPSRAATAGNDGRPARSNTTSQPARTSEAPASRPQAERSSQPERSSSTPPPSSSGGGRTENGSGGGRPTRGGR